MKKGINVTVVLSFCDISFFGMMLDALCGVLFLAVCPRHDDLNLEMLVGAAKANMNTLIFSQLTKYSSSEVAPKHCERCSLYC